MTKNSFLPKHIFLPVFLILILLLFFFPVMASNKCQSKEKIIGKAGNISISEQEFLKRYEFTPHVRSADNFDSTSFKKNFLYTLIAEKLLAQSAAAEGMDKSQNFRVAMDNLSDLYLRDALYKKEVLDKIVVPDSEIVVGKVRMMRTIRTKFIFSQDKEEIDRIFSEIDKGASFDSILTTRPERKEQKDAAEVTFGTMNEKMEEALYKVSVGQITFPIELKEGWYICKIYSITKKFELDSRDKSKIEKIIKSRIEDKIYQEFYKTFFRGTVINADRPMVEKLFKVIMGYLIENKNNLVKNRGSKYKIGEIDIPKIKKYFTPDELKNVFIKFPNNPLRLSGMFDYLSFNDFEFLKVDSIHIKNMLNSYIKFYIQNELLAREAKKRGYANLPGVASELKIWRDYYLSHEMTKKIFNSEPVADDDAYNFFVKANQIIQQPDEVNVAEILSDNLDTIELVLKEVDKGADFKELAKKHTIRDSLKERGGEFGFFKISEKGEIGKIASSMKIGEVFGPIKAQDGYSVIKLLDKREGRKEKVSTFEEAKSAIKNILKTEKMYKKLDEITANLALEYGVVLDEGALNSLKVSTIDMVVLRRFGFGSQFLAIPNTPNFSSWFKKYESMKVENPL
jgi:parvulin-like peptidyl-prolyl isomerase